MPKSTALTSIAVVNAMVGSSLIILPLNFLKYGIIVNIFFVILMAFLMGLTCHLLYAHLAAKQIDISQSVTRKLGPIYGKGFGAISSSILFLVASVYFLLAIDIFYDVFIDIFSLQGFPQKLFKLILLVIFGGFIFLKNIQMVFKAAPYAMGGLIISTLALIISIGFNTQNIDSSFMDFKSLSIKDVIAIASINGFAFICHPSISPIIKQHENQKQNWKPIVIGYGCTLLMYLIVGVLGALSIYGKNPQRDHSIIDYFSGSFQSPLIGILVFLYIVSIFPIFPFVSKNQFIQLIPKSKKQKIPNIAFKASIVFAALWIPMNALFIIFETSPEKVIQFLSAIMCFYITYFLPVFMTLRKGDYEKIRKQNDDSLIIPDTVDDQNNDQKRQQQKAQSHVNVRQIQLWQKGLYTFVMIVGSIILITSLIQMFV